mmetsp:Transcript_3035/g.3379  ORF Transcript_3035/g.3379 Transcript_3035/m.3379 type:complete len:551 (-) Transcript_3035:210-1862(-)
MVVEKKKEEDKGVREGHNLGDCQCPQVDIASNWRDERNLADGGSQTEPIPTHFASCQAGNYEEAESQTDDVVFTQVSSGVSSEELVPFLNSVMPMMEAGLKNNNESTAFVEQDTEDDDHLATADCIHQLRMAPEIDPRTLPEGENPEPDPLVVTGITWNATGYVIAVSYGRYDISGWCNTQGALCTWNLGRKDINPNKPDVHVEVDNCLQCCAFHPTHPALVAGGTFNGELYVWDLSRDDLQRSKSRVTDYTHREPITQIVWQFNLSEASKHSDKESAYQIITCSTDGRILVWAWNKLDNPVYGYELLRPHPDTSKMVLWGATGIGFHPHTALAEDQGASLLSTNQGTFVVGTDGGTVYRCLMHHNSQMEAEFTKAVSSNGKVKFRSPIRAEYEAHAGIVAGVDCSPFQRNLFASSGIDGTIRVYNMLQAKAVMKLEPCGAYAYSCQWSPFRPLVMASATGDGRIAIYDFLKSVLHPVKMIDVRGKAEPVYATAFNSKLREYLAASDGQTVKVYELGERFTQPRGAEQRLLNRMADSEGGGDIQQSFNLR